MRYLLDTNVVSDARAKRSPELMSWLSGQAVGDLALSVVSILELELGVRLKERRDPAGANLLRVWLEEDLKPMFAGRILGVDEPVAVVAAGFHVPDPMPEMDALIAATAAVHDLVLVTRNVMDFQRAGVRLLNPWLES
ncbi:type II toxin-antitoxin system VapC family toxin [Tessaracoccus caeni]|uniref:type II toxin-antitoxin system VapC family toxin n=1 Tax=Tessaracoccus caeni TaxID=3031239 RepID=UPI0023DCBE59|nr:type II toxin-antitoxin system VapC family toxin [Tessaracoccus caeni]MDF1490387.1 type II toxin-antitoxin system VapC family toxin [Tessaracoccus caeni]